MPLFAEFVAMMALLMALTALSIDVMLPALPAIATTRGAAFATPCRNRAASSPSKAPTARQANDATA